MKRDRDRHVANDGASAESRSLSGASVLGILTHPPLPTARTSWPRSTTPAGDARLDRAALRPSRHRRRRHTLASVRGDERHRRDVHLQSLPVREGGRSTRSSRDMRRARAARRRQRSPSSSNDPADYPDDSFDNMKALRGAKRASRFRTVIDETQDVAQRVRRGLHAGFLRLRPRSHARLPRPPRQLRALARSRRARASCFDAMVGGRAHRPARPPMQHAVGRLLDQVEALG